MFGRRDYLIGVGVDERNIFCLMFGDRDASGRYGFVGRVYGLRKRYTVVVITLVVFVFISEHLKY